MELLNYLLKVCACSVLFFTFYFLFLRKLTFFRANRFYLLGALLLSFLIPSLSFTVKKEVPQIAMVRGQNSSTVELFEGPTTTGVLLASTAPEMPETFNVLLYFPYLYILILALLLIHAARRLFQLISYTKGITKEIDGLKVVSKHDGFTNCSFFNYVFLADGSLTTEEVSVLLKHEAVHAENYHSIDKILMMIIKAILWFNPVIYLYDRALEQNHEFEADDTTSASFGTGKYAGLLLSLAVSRGSTPLVHNFVKSPVKERIKMLFNAKSKNMKKLIYLLAVPIGLALVWGFTVEVVYALPQTETLLKQDTLKTRKQTREESLRAFKVYRQSAEYQQRYQEAKSINGKTLIGIVGDKYEQPQHAMMSSGMLFKVGTKTYVLQDGNGNNNISKTVRKNDQLEVKVYGSSFTKDVPYVVIGAQTITKDGKVLFEKPPIKKEPFLYEANRARFAWSTVKSVQKDGRGIITKIVLNDKLFTINLNIAAQQFKSTNFKPGDAVLVKFIGEKAIGNRTWTTDKLIVLYSQPKKHELRNNTLYKRFYHEDGTQIVPDLNANINSKNIQKAESYTPTVIKPKLISSHNLTLDRRRNTLLVKDWKMELGNQLTLIAEEIAYNRNAQTVSAKKASIFLKNGDVIKGDLINWDLTENTYKVNNTAGAVNPTKRIVSNQVSSYKYYSADSVRISKSKKNMTLYGNVRLNLNDLTLKGDKMEIYLRSL